MKNSGKSSESLFENTFNSVYGTRAFVQQFYDAAYLHGMNRRPVKAPDQPADRLVTANGETFYAEIKSVTNGTSFPFSMIKPGQLKAARLQTLAGGLYNFFVHDLATDTFYLVPASQVLSTLAAGKKSLKWNEMTIWQDYETYKESHG